MTHYEEMIKDMQDFMNEVKSKHKFKIGEKVRFYHYGCGMYLDGEIVGYQYDCGDLKYRIKYDSFMSENKSYALVDECCICANVNKDDKKVNSVKQENKCENKTEKVNEAQNVKEDPVNHPSHYDGKTSIECIDSMLITFGVEYVFHFCMCNAYKYLWRHKNKNGLEDVKKAEYYLNKATNICTSYPEASIYGEDVDMLSRLENQLFDAFMFYGVDKRVKKD